MKFFPKLITVHCFFLRCNAHFLYLSSKNHTKINKQLCQNFQWYVDLCLSFKLTKMRLLNLLNVRKFIDLLCKWHGVFSMFPVSAGKSITVFIHHAITHQIHSTDFGARKGQGRSQRTLCFANLPLHDPELSRLKFIFVFTVSSQNFSLPIETGVDCA